MKNTERNQRRVQNLYNRFWTTIERLKLIGIDDCFGPDRMTESQVLRCFEEMQAHLTYPFREEPWD